MLAVEARYERRKEGAERMTLFRNDVARKVLQDFLGYESKRKAGGYMDVPVMSIVRLDACMGSNCGALPREEKEMRRTSTERV